MQEALDSKLYWSEVQGLFLERVARHEARLCARGRAALRSRASSSFSSRIFFPADTGFRDIVRETSQGMTRFKNIRHLNTVIVKVIFEKVHVTHAALLIYDPRMDAYVVAASRGMEASRLPEGFVRIAAQDVVPAMCREAEFAYLFTRGIFNVRTVRWMCESGHFMGRDEDVYRRVRAALHEMSLLKASLLVPCFFKRELLGILLIGPKQSGRTFTDDELLLFSMLSNDASMAIANTRLIEDLKQKVDEAKHLYEREHELFINMVIALAKAIDARDVYTRGHTERVTHYCLILFDYLKGMLSETQKGVRFREMLHIAALLHDIGKIGVPDRILIKKGPLTPAERVIVERHPEIGADILYPVKELNEVCACVRAHQEWYDGRGYPDGLSGDRIPLIARIVGVADAFDAITSDRPYRAARNADCAITEIQKCSGSQFDPVIVKALVDAYQAGHFADSDTAAHI